MNRPDSGTIAATEPLFAAHGISKTFHKNSEITVLRSINFAIAPKEMVAIIGDSGTGKTTLLHILGTLERPSSGRLIYRGKDIFAQNDKALSHFRNKTIGFVFQSHHLLPEFTALENIIMPGLIAGKKKKALLGRAEELLSKMGMAGRVDHKVGELSGGEQQRIALARALIMKPALLLADEPTGNLDPGTGRRVFDLLTEMNEIFKISTVMVTHNYQLAAKMDRCLKLDNGKLTQLNDFS
ncbi:MAG: ABC transporter ATP-binding protein [Deltaproteobacteria bacterium]|nr:ABC transporter ATP-binding protein [Deltaproteobacteria bacterium]